MERQTMSDKGKHQAHKSFRWEAPFPTFNNKKENLREVKDWIEERCARREVIVRKLLWLYFISSSGVRGFKTKETFYNIIVNLARENTASVHGSLWVSVVIGSNMAAQALV